MSSLILINGVVFTLIPSVVRLQFLSGFFFCHQNFYHLFLPKSLYPPLFLSQQIMFLFIFFHRTAVFYNVWQAG